MKLNVSFDHRIPPCVLDVSTVIYEKLAERRGSIQYQEVLLELSEKKCFMSRFCWFS